MTSSILIPSSVSVPEFETTSPVLGEFLHDRFVIPGFHREYVWSPNMANDTLLFMFTMLDRGEPASIRTITITSGDPASDEGDGVYEIVDGLQRLVTLLLILSALRRQFLKASTDDDVDQHDRAYAAARAQVLQAALCCSPNADGTVPVRLTGRYPGAEVLHILLRSGDTEAAVAWLAHEAKHGKYGALAEYHGGRVLNAWRVLNRTLKTELRKRGGFRAADGLAYQVHGRVYLGRRVLKNRECRHDVYVAENT
jgi:hypothetical protein